ncbi:MAG: hypothetical protein AAFQ80_11715 [Cyanobacteria bacterium J06621_8]
MMLYPYRILIDGGLTSLILTVLIVGTIFWNYRWWLADFPPALQDILPPQTTQERQKAILIAIGFFAIIILGMAVSFSLLQQQIPVKLNFFSAWLHGFLFFQVFNLWDLIVIDWIGCLFIDPSNPPIPGTENSPGYRDYWFHFQGFLQGILIGILFSLLAAAIVTFFG